MSQQRETAQVLPAIVSVKPISFSAELQHASVYLAVEQVQFKVSLMKPEVEPLRISILPPQTKRAVKLIAGQGKKWQCS